jgi:hypothetical protein
MPIDHTSVSVPASKAEAFATFLKTALKPLGIDERMAFPGSIGLGDDKTAHFWIQSVDLDPEEEKAAMKLAKKWHIAFVADSELFPMAV